jgi:hypothetical protein
MGLSSNSNKKCDSVKIKKDTAFEVERKFHEELFEDFLYIIGPARGGTSVFWRAIVSDSNIFPVRRKVKKFDYWQKMDNIDFVFEKMFRIPFDMLYEKIESDYVDDIKARISAAYKNGDIRKILACKSASDFVMNSEMKSPHNYSCWAMKTNDFNELKLYKDALKKAKFVFLIRNPHSTILSQITRMGKKKGLKDNNRFLLDVIRTSLFWCRFAKSMIYFLKNYPEDTILIRYEDWVENPEFETCRVFNFAGIMQIDKNELRSNLNQVGGVATNNSDERYQGVSKMPLNRWSTEMKKHDVAIVSFFTQRIAQKFGYQFANAKYELTAPIL